MQSESSGLLTFIERLESELPDFVSDRDLIDIGVANTPAHLHHMRVRGQMPPYVRIGSKIRYAKADVIAWYKAQCCFQKDGEVANV